MNVTPAIRNGIPTEILTPDDLTCGSPVGTNLIISQGFGIRSVTGSIHQGIDIVVGNVDSLSVEDGVVISTYPYGRDVPGLSSDGSPGGYGNTVLIEHKTPSGFYYRSYYCHLLPYTITVKAGDRVVRGQKIGVTDTTGISTGNHMHFELRLNDIWPTRFEPYRFINRVVKPPEPEDWFLTLSAAGREYAEALFNDEKKRANLTYALAVMDALEAAKPGAEPIVVGSSLVTLGPDGRKAAELDGAALAEVHIAKKINPVTHQEEWDMKVLNSLQLQRLREQRQWLLANGFLDPAEPPAPGNPPEA